MEDKDWRPKYTCCLCHKEFRGSGNNPAPLASSDKKCCETCNKEVIARRFVEMYA